MKLTLQIQLLPVKQQADQLRSTMERFNEACSWLAEQAFESIHRVGVHRLEFLLGFQLSAFRRQLLITPTA
jgi:predicted transposase